MGHLSVEDIDNRFEVVLVSFFILIETINEEVEIVVFENGRICNKLCKCLSNLMWLDLYLYLYLPWHRSGLLLLVR
jgi:hypothetical protein